MKVAELESREVSDEISEIVNDFSIQVATVNGSGSQSSNNVLMKAIFHMGVPVSGKNLFPSNIAGLPTWFTIRASKDGFVARRKEIDVLIAMNRQTLKEDVAQVEPGGVVIYEEKHRPSELREDLVYYPVPFNDLAQDIVEDSRLRKLVANMVYVGSVAELLSIPMKNVEVAIADWFSAKKKAIELNIRAARLGSEYVREHLTKKDSFRLESMQMTEGKIIIDGNSACAIGAFFAGITVMTWYPITPSSSLAEKLIEVLNRYRVDPETGKASFAVVQAEDELAALGVALGAGWAGARAMTATSGPGISLMAEFVGFGYFAEIPCVIFDVQRIGPSTGLPTRTSQGDILSLYFLSHGDTKHLVLFPGDMKECFEMGYQAFDLADRFQQPVFVATDLDLGMNNWMTEPFSYPDTPLDRGKVLTAEELDRVGEFARYKDLDDDGIPYRTLPNTENPLAAYFTRGSGHDENASYSERPQDYEKQMDRLTLKHETAKEHLPQPVVQIMDKATIGIIAFGSSHPAVEESRVQLRNQYAIESSYLRIRALPFADELRRFLTSSQRVYVVEQNRDGQMADLLRMEFAEQAAKIRKIRHYTGLPLDARFVTDRIVDQETAVKAGEEGS